MNIAVRDTDTVAPPAGLRFEGAPFFLPEAKSAPLPAPAAREAAAPSGAAFTFKGVRKAFGPKTVLHGLDLHVPAGQFVAVIGKSGCGKSTLLRLLTGLDAPTAGTLEIASTERRADITRVMFQEPRLLPWARVAANVAVGLSHMRDRREKHAAALSLLAQVGLSDRAGEWPAVLSGGQRQRVALARALASRPRILALDEPLGALDALTRIEMQMLLERIWLKQGFTAVLVTHDVAEAVALADRVVLIEDGAIALDVEVPLPRPRRRGSPELARLEGIILEQLLGAPA
ncbi:ATP-binding cassette domain-containing protein [Xanthobacter tagetidis]|uniref:ATP-binding cassette domain-containing protein n=1 Tax=Xanthobacter tagetidis TaxID=60216 RepID=A0A3L7AP27_9HYPH|nr:ATP-binding cassette domain-containing protein [Xanthobacter tagetidis]MBB6307618.1 sulfonate transport system ATP-binding protein [Xanthobacter tagetidis]RLP81182.1 ATP-binding cassette domain-containing protein [Xanthobacter tagetidis]